jgi:Rrf2 family iron-sulfur cluster assembly transcriptional regulator
MRLSTKSRFAVTAMIDIALRDHAGPVSLADIGARHQISLSYLEQLFSKLRQSGLVESTRGPGGGYSLGRNSQAISVADIIAAVETGAERPVRGEKTAQSSDSEGVAQELWAALSERMVEHMQSISLRQLVGEQRIHVVETPVKPAKRGVFAKPRMEAARASVPNSVFALGKTLLAGR